LGFTRRRRESFTPAIKEVQILAHFLPGLGRWLKDFHTRPHFLDISSGRGFLKFYSISEIDLAIMSWSALSKIVEYSRTLNSGWLVLIEATIGLITSTFHVHL
jgi:hypothetical protein